MYKSDGVTAPAFDEGFAKLDYMFEAPFIAIYLRVIKVQGYGVLYLISLKISWTASQPLENA